MVQRCVETPIVGELILHTGEDNFTTPEFYSTMGYKPWEIVIGRTLNHGGKH
mgnify:CR=1 FL=1